MPVPDTFDTDRLHLRPVGPADAPAIYDGYARHLGPTRFMDFARHVSLAESEAFAARCGVCWQDGSAYPWALIGRDSGGLIGVIELRLRPPNADFGYILGEAFWKRGYASEAAKAVVRLAFAQPGIVRVWATCHPDNHASARVLEKAGLRFEARLAARVARPQLGEQAGDSLLYAATSPDP